VDCFDLGKRPRAISRPRGKHMLQRLLQKSFYSPVRKSLLAIVSPCAEGQVRPASSFPPLASVERQMPDQPVTPVQPLGHIDIHVPN